MELAAVGVSIALFNQVSRIAIFPLVSVTTSFVAEEDTIGRVSSEAQESDYVETGSFVDTESNELIPQKGAAFLFQIKDQVDSNFLVWSVSFENL